MQSSSWQCVRQLLVVFPGDAAVPIVLQKLHQCLPEAEITLLVPSPQAVSLVTGEVLVHPAVGDIDQTAPLLQDLISTLRPYQFEGAVIFTRTSQSPHVLAYVCYLAGIPLRLGQSQEFSGGVLSHWIQASPQQTHDLDHYLYLLEQGLSTAVPAIAAGRESR